MAAVASSRPMRAAAAPASAPAMEAAKAAGELSYGGEIQEEAGKAQESVRNVGNRTFYRRQNQWIDSQVTSDAAAERPQGQAVQQGVFRPGQPLRPHHVAVPGHG